MVTDPVCGMEVNPELCKIRETYKEYEYFFCSEACQKVFIMNPERHVPWRSGRPNRRKRTG